MSGAPPEPQSGSRELMRPRLLKHIRPFWELADLAGGDVDGLLAQLALTRAELRDPSTRRPYYQIHWLTEQLIAQCADPEVGLRAAERTQFVNLEMVGHLIRHFVQVSPNLFVVLELLARFWTRVSESTQTTLTVQDDRVVISIVPTVELPPPPEVYDGVAGACCRLIQTLGGAGVRPLEVRLPRACPTRPARYEQFFDAPVVFESARLELVYAYTALTLPASDVDQLLGATAPASPTHTAPGWPSADTLVQQVQERILAALADGVPSLPDLARKLGVGERTLRRRLQAARTGYAELVDEARRRRALILASRAELDVAHLAQLTGFGDASAFARAFRRWTGERPTMFIRRMRERARLRLSR